MKILRIAMNGEEQPYFTITRAFEKFAQTDTIWWQDYEVNNLNRIIIDKVKTGNYDAVFMQLQCGHILKEETAKEIAKHTLVYNWTGDVRTDLSDFKYIGQHVTTLFTNTNDVNTMRELGFKSEYLQTGYDHKHYNNPYPLEVRKPQIAFCANYYPKTDFPLKQDRIDMIRSCQYYFGDRFKLHGSNWNIVDIKASPMIGNAAEAELYQQSTIALNLSHFNYGRYYSDRLLREMACGALVLSHDFKWHHLEFQEGKHFVIWKDINDLLEKCNYYLDPENYMKGRQIANRGMLKVEKECRWENRVQELILLIGRQKRMNEE